MHAFNPLLDWLFNTAVLLSLAEWLLVVFWWQPPNNIGSRGPRENKIGKEKKQKMLRNSRVLSHSLWLAPHLWNWHKHILKYFTGCAFTFTTCTQSCTYNTVLKWSALSNASCSVLLSKELPPVYVDSWAVLLWHATPFNHTESQLDFIVPSTAWGHPRMTIEKEKSLSLRTDNESLHPVWVVN